MEELNEVPEQTEQTQQPLNEPFKAGSKEFKDAIKKARNQLEVSARLFRVDEKLTDNIHRIVKSGGIEYVEND